MTKLRAAPALSLCLGLCAALSACAPAVVRAGNGHLTATAQTPGGALSFDCDPAANAALRGAPIILSGGEATFSCPSLSVTSSGARATLTVPAVTFAPLPRSAQVNVAPDGQPPVYRSVQVAPTSGEGRQVLLVVLTLPGADGAAPQTYSAQAGSSSRSSFQFFGSAGLSGTFAADLGGGVNVQGSFDLRAR